MRGAWRAAKGATRAAAFPALLLWESPSCLLSLPQSFSVEHSVFGSQGSHLPKSPCAPFTHFSLCSCRFLPGSLSSSSVHFCLLLLSQSVAVSVSLFLSLSLSVSVFQSVSVFTSPYLSLFPHLFIFMFLSASGCLPLCLSPASTLHPKGSPLPLLVSPVDL